MMPPLLLKLTFDRLPEGVPFVLRPILRAVSTRVKERLVLPNLERMLDHVEAELGRSTWFAGETLTMADVQMSYPLEAAVLRAGLDARRPRTMAWLERIHARPAYQRALERGGPYALVS
jgi:glutathione S-transferase